MNRQNSASFASSRSTVQARVRRERMFVMGGGTLIIALLVLATLVLTNKPQVEAMQEVSVVPKATEEIAFGTVVLLAPTSEVAKGTKLSRVELTKIYWPRDQVPENAVRDIDNVRDLYAKRNLVASQPIVRSDLTVSPPSYGISDVLPEGHRATSLQVDAEEGVEGWATPGAHVDVLLTYMDREEQRNKTRLIVEGAVVLSFDGSTRAGRDTTARQVGGRMSGGRNSTVTLMVSLEDSMELQTAKAMGKISLVLRNVSDSSTPASRVFSPEKWEKTPQKTSKKKNSSIRGFVRMSDDNGEEKTLILQDESWWEADNSGDKFGE